MTWLFSKISQFICLKFLLNGLTLLERWIYLTFLMGFIRLV